jgi:hypothetical protein
MIIKALTIENFKGIREPVRVEFKPITLLFGANSAGKSTIVQALHYVREILERNNVDADRSTGADESFDLGGFQNLVHNHDLSRRMLFKIEMSLDVCDIEPFQTGHITENDPSDGAYFKQDTTYWDINQAAIINTCWIELEVKWSYLLGRPLLSSYSTGFNDVHFATITCAEDGKRVRISDINPEHGLKRDDEIDVIWDHYNDVINHNIVGSGRDLNLLLTNPTVLPNWKRPLSIAEECFIPEHCEGPYYGLINALEGYLSQLLIGPWELLTVMLKKSRYIGPIRKTPPRAYKSVRSEDESRWASGLAAWDILYKSSMPFIDEVSSWLSREDRLNAGYSVKMSRFKKLDMDGPIYRVLASGEFLDEEIATQVESLPEEKQLILIDEKRRLEVLPQDIGIGISQLLPVVVGSLDKGTDILMIEQPELHIHPGLQVNLGDLFISQIQNGSKLFIIETHSEHLLLRLLRRIRETSDEELPVDTAPLYPEELSVNYVEHSDDGLRIRQLEISPDGDSLGEWPKGFFEERSRELY